MIAHNSYGSTAAEAQCKPLSMVGLIKQFLSVFSLYLAKEVCDRWDNIEQI